MYENGSGKSHITERIKAAVDKATDGRANHYNFDRFFQGGNLYGKKVPVADLMAELDRQAKTKKDFVVATDKMTMVYDYGPGYHLRFPGPEGFELSYRVRSIAHEQLAERTGIPLKYYQRMQVDRPALLCSNVNSWLPDRDRRLVRTLDDQVRAVLSDKFRTLDNIDLAFGAFKVFQEVGAEVVSCELSDGRFYLRAVNPNVAENVGLDDDILGGVVVSNSEVGKGALRIESFCLRLACMNGFVGEDVFARAHLGERLEIGILQADTIKATNEAIWLQVRDYIKNAFSKEVMVDWTKKFRKAATIKIEAGPTELASGHWSGYAANSEEKDGILKHLFGDGMGMSQWGLANAMTAQASETPDPDRRTELERMGYDFATMEEDRFHRTIEELCVVPRTAKVRVK